MTRGEWFASREYGLIREAVIKRANGRCERCGAEGKQVHHLNYDRPQGELLTDLQYVCRECHEYLSAKRHDDPALEKKKREAARIARQMLWDQARDELAADTQGVVWQLVAERCNILKVIQPDTATESRLEIQQRAEAVRLKMYGIIDARAKELQEQHANTVAMLERELQF